MGRGIDHPVAPRPFHRLQPDCDRDHSHQNHLLAEPAHLQGDILRHPAQPQRFRQIAAALFAQQPDGAVSNLIRLCQIGQPAAAVVLIRVIGVRRS
ncbi:hypothetical protein [Rhodobacter sp. 24-YEA-8]|uniref:hypothetical protein n=1 Tax=Rhodobacter sp. 24-YEA-8 TaxID=1884310 RepID=UPI00115F9A8E|nr:hypothetical protein [Rhodobacter sp. 24-YEA-8]